MKTGDLSLALILIALLAGSSAAQGFGFCFSFGGGNKNRGDFHGRPPPPVGYGPGIYQVYPYSPVYAGPYSVPFYMPPPVMPEYPNIPQQPVESR